MKIALVTSPHLDHTIFHQATNESALPRQVAQQFAPMGLISIAGAVADLASVSILDFNKALNSRRLPLDEAFYDAAAEWILAAEPDLVGFMTECDSYHHLLRVCEAIKDRRASTLTLLGGVHATAAHRETLEEFAAVDLVMRGEGEIGFRQLVEVLHLDSSLQAVGNLTYRAGTQVVENPPLPLIGDLDELPWPDFSRFDLEPEDVIYLEVGRGCPFKCNFCFTAPYWQRKHRIKSAERVIRELRYFQSSYGRSDFNFTHDLLTTDRRWVIDFCQKLTEADLQVAWTCSSRTDTIDDEQIEWMRKAGCRNIYYGVEAGTAVMQKAIDKNLDLGEADTNIGKTVQAGIGVTVGFIAGLPGESSDTLRGSLERAFKYLSLPQSTVHMFGFNAYRGSANHDGVKDLLQFDPHFVDFPLPEAVHRENCAMMEPRFPIFSRYSRIKTYGDLDTSVVRAADEFFPIVNALRDFMLGLQQEGVDLMILLSDWASWIRTRNRARGRAQARLYQGSIDDFLDFTAERLTAISGGDAVLADRIRWERLKNAFRGKAHRPLALGYMPDSSLSLLYVNPTARVETFESGTSTVAPGSYAFYLNPDGEPAIARLNSLAAAVLTVASDGAPVDALLDAVMESVADEDKNTVSTAAVTLMLDDLERLGLLLHPSEVHRLINEWNGTPAAEVAGASAAFASPPA